MIYQVPRIEFQNLAQQVETFLAYPLNFPRYCLRVTLDFFFKDRFDVLVRVEILIPPEVSAGINDLAL